MYVVYLNIQLYNLTVLHITVDIDTSVKLLTQIAFQDFQAVFLCTDYKWHSQLR